ncbi:hypothetical protein [Salinibacter ruber]|uniref:Sulfotransferase n=1 Tax=Salinibacter ruber TaxID=146919 RepID=A0A9X2V7U2_9BACT|nr:hypothetical protein [Salinibacter ruber]MCS4122723.1 hypothetical protein [Salinibacter ruber]
MTKRTKERWWRRFLNLIPCDTEEAIVISGTARGGTTWLGEIIGTLPGCKFLGEPLNYGMDRPVYEIARPPHGPPFQHPTGDAPKLRAYFRQALEGRVPGGWHLGTDSSAHRLFRHLARRRVVMKLVQGNRLLHWLAHTFEVRGIVMLVRHPCAVVASMQRYGNWAYATLTPDAPSFSHIEKALPDVLVNDIRSRLPNLPTSKEEMLALRWALDYYIPFFVHRDAGHPWILVPYERLVASGLNAASNDLLGRAVFCRSNLQREVWTDEVRPELV